MSSNSSGQHEQPSTDCWKNWDDKEMHRRWELFARFGSGQSHATEISGKNFDKWLRDAGVLDGKNTTTVMTDLAFTKAAGPKRKTLDYNKSKQVLLSLAEDRATRTKKPINKELDLIINRLKKLEGPSVAKATKAVHTNVVDRLTDVSKYTGSHKERFDPETGRGKGKAGREDIVECSGYVASYKNKGTYDKIHGPVQCH